MRGWRYFARVIRALFVFTLTFFTLAFPGCESDSSPLEPADSRQSDSSVNANSVHVDIDARRPAIMLSEYRLFADLKNQVPNEGKLFPRGWTITSNAWNAGPTNVPAGRLAGIWKGLPRRPAMCCVWRWSDPIRKGR